MDINKFKGIKLILFWGGLGFAISSILGLDGFKDTIQLSQLFIGIGIIIVAVILHVNEL